jgi:hypothetical protein
VPGGGGDGLADLIQHCISSLPGQKPEWNDPPEQPLFWILRQWPDVEPTLQEIFTQHYVIAVRIVNYSESDWRPYLLGRHLGLLDTGLQGTRCPDNLPYVYTPLFLPELCNYRLLRAREGHGTVMHR